MARHSRLRDGPMSRHAARINPSMAPAGTGQDHRHTKDGVRVVTLTHEDGRWTFSVGGAELPFEEVTAYQRSRRADRLTPDMLSRYAAAVDIPVSNPDTYNGQAVLLRRTQQSGQPPQISVEAATAARAELEAIIASRIKTTD